MPDSKHQRNLTYLLAPVVGNINPPPGVNLYINQAGATGGGLILFINNILKLLIVVAGIFAVFQFIFAGYGFISAGGDSKKMSDAWTKIWQTVLGLIVVFASFTLSAVISKIFLGDWTAILHPKIYGPR